MSKPSSSAAVKVWDLPVRLFHWSLVTAVAALFLSAQLDALPVHALIGEFVLGLVLLRILWGFIGSRTARFADFVAGPKRIRRYLQTGKSETIGHNPLGGWMILFLMAALLTQAGLGLMANDDVSFEGPLAHLVGAHWSNLATGAHHLLFALLALMAAVHVGAVLVHLLIKRENLIRPMITGWKAASSPND
jgi:cytochrome b